MRQQLVRILVVLGVTISCIALWIRVVPDPKIAYYQNEVPVMQVEAARIPGVTFRGVYDPHYNDELNPYVILDVHGRGLLVLFHPDRTSFTGGGPLNVVGVGDCEHAENFSVQRTSATFEDVQFATVAELVAQYDQVYKAATRGACTRWVWEDNTSLTDYR